MKTSTERHPVYAEFGKIEFKLKGNLITLNVYQNIELIRKPGFENLFIPFTDLTNGEETYGAGRYLDFKIPESEKVIIDFNLAYNPYCAYNHSYSCPIPPKENNLNIKIEAGEKTFEQE